jgi:hypothetical protein
VPRGGSPSVFAADGHGRCTKISGGRLIRWSSRADYREECSVCVCGCLVSTYRGVRRARCAIGR